MEHCHPVAEVEGLLLLVRDEDGGDPDPPDQPLELAAGALAQRRIEVRERLVEQQHARLGRQGAGERDPLLLAAGELPDPPLLVAREVDQRERLGDPPARRRSLVARVAGRSATFSPTVRCGKSA